MSTTTLATRPTRTSLSQIASTLARIAAGYDEAAEIEAGFDGGEWSGPAIAAGYESAVRAALADQGWTGVDYLRELSSRTSDRFAHFSGLDRGVETATCLDHGEQDVAASRTTTGFDPTVVSTLACGCVTL